MPVFQLGQINTTALIVPDLYVQIVPPQVSLLNGVPTNILGIVGTATWGPVNNPTDVGNMAEYSDNFGPIPPPRKYDLGTACALAIIQGAQAIKAVRVTDGTDTAASAVITATDAIKSVTVGGTAHIGDLATLTVTPNGGSAVPLAYTLTGTDTLNSVAVTLANMVNNNPTLQAAGISADTPIAGVFNVHYPQAAVAILATSVTGGGATTTLVAGSATTIATPQITLTSKWTGSLGNQTTISIAVGAAANSFRCILTIPGSPPESFENITGVGNVFWKNLANAINLGQSGLRGPSQILNAVAGPGASVPAVPLNPTLTGGTDGVTTITGSTMVGVDSIPRTGMYSLRGQFCSVGFLADVDDSTTWALQVAFGLFEGVYMILVGPAGQSIASAVTQKQTAGIDSYAVKVLLGDWIFWLDTVNGQVRTVSPQGFVAGLLSNMSPQNSSLNKQLFGVTGTQKSASGLAYTSADLQTLALAGIDVIANPVPGGFYFGPRIGHNSSSNPVIQGDNYTRMTNYIAATINHGMGIYIGQLQTPKVRKNAKATLDAFFSGLYQQGMIGTADGLTLPWQVILDDSNNPQPRVALGYMQADCQVIYLSVIEKFIINVEGGQSVVINRVSTQVSAQ